MPTSQVLRSVLLGSMFLLLSCPVAEAAGAITVGPSGRMFTTPCAAFAAAGAGATVQIDAATYSGDSCRITQNALTIEGVGGRPRIDAAGTNFGGKGTWVVDGDDTTIRNVEMSGASVSPGDGSNGAAIRQEGTGLTLTGVFLHDNQNGLLVNPDPDSDIVIQSSEFARNGFGDGYTHNMYIGRVRSFTLRASWSHDAVVGHLVKSRALTNRILDNRLTEQGGSGSYELDLPDAGLSYVIGNVVQQGSATENPTMLAYGEEGGANSDHHLYVVNNTFVNDDGSGTPVHVGVSQPALIQNNISVGSTAGITDQAAATVVSNCAPAQPLFVDRTAFDYHLRPGSPCIDAGTPPGSANGVALAPVAQYVYDVAEQPRAVVGPAIDAGAFEYAPPGPPAVGVLFPGPGASGGSGAAASTMRVLRLTGRRGGAIRVRVVVGGAGTLVVTARARVHGRARPLVYASARRTARRAGTITIQLRPRPTARRALTKARRLRVVVGTSFTAAGRRAVTRTSGITVRARRAGRVGR